VLKLLDDKIQIPRQKDCRLANEIDEKCIEFSKGVDKEKIISLIMKIKPFSRKAKGSDLVKFLVFLLKLLLYP